MRVQKTTSLEKESGCARLSSTDHYAHHGWRGEEEITLYFLTPMQCHQSSAGDPDVCDSDTDSRSLPNPAYVQPTRQPKHATKTATRQSNLHYCKQ